LDYRTATRDERVADFITVATELHNGRYDYRHVEHEYVNGDTRVTIICPDHGPFQQTPREHRRVRDTKYGAQRGQGCKDCRGFNANVELRRERFIAKAVTVHGNRYDYSDVVYIDARTDVAVSCSEHGAFAVRPDNHTGKYRSGCPGCAMEGHRASAHITKGKNKGHWAKRPAGTTTGRHDDNQERRRSKRS
jgi:hypothetical protein